MKLSSITSSASPSSSLAARGAFTLVEVLVSTALFSIVLAGLVYGNVYGLKMCELTKIKLTRSHEGRLVLGKLAEEIRSAKTTWVGSLDGSGSFQATLEGQPQTGSALLIYPTTNKANYIVYYVNPADKSFRRITSASSTPTLLASLVTNSVIFRAQDYAGNVLTNSQNNRVTKIQLNFFQARGEMAHAEYYTLETAVTRRAID
jgi:prepilin-type N-terminal cleavage/methylation domain-containing protein